LDNLRLVFFGTADLASHSLRALAACPRWTVVAVVSQPDRPKGRDLKLVPTPVKTAALELGLPILQPQKARDPGVLEALQTFRPDLIAVAAYGQILPRSILELPRYGCLNVHTSLLPAHRGAAPIQWSLYHGESVTGVTIMKMDAGMDTGAILTQWQVPIEPGDTGQTLHDRLAKVGGDLLVDTIPGYVEGRIMPVPQDHSRATYARKIQKEDGWIDWRRPAAAICNQVRAFTPWPGAFTTRVISGKPQMLKIWRVTCEEGTTAAPGVVVSADAAGLLVGTSKGLLRVLELQREGGKRLPAAEFLAGMRVTVGEQWCSSGGSPVTG
jgi:methionyl-tRNA formyltransferase